MSDPTSKKPESPAEQWRAVMLTGLGEEARELEEASDGMIDDALRLQGINPERLAKEGNALAARLMREAAGLPPEPQAEPTAPAAADVVSGPTAAASLSSPDLGADRVNETPSDPVTAQAEVYILPPRRRARWPLLLVAAAVATAAVTAGVTIARNDDAPHPTPKDVPDPNPARHERPTLEVAAAIRQDAERDCREARWEECREKLDNAQALDPQGDEAESVQTLRSGIGKALRPAPAADEAGAKRSGDKGPGDKGPR